MTKSLESSSVSGKVTEAKLGDFQKILDSIEEQYRYDTKYDDDRYKLFELQALIHSFAGDDDRAVQFANEAVVRKPEGKHFVSKIIEDVIKPQQISEDYPETSGSYKSHVEFLQNNFPSKEPVFFQTSAKKAGILMFFTLGLYSLYWFYKHWIMIRVSTGEKVTPILRAIFQIFFVFSLFGRIEIQASQKGYAGFKNDGVLATLYIALVIADRGTDRIPLNSVPESTAYLVASLAVSAAIAWIIYSAQKAANYSNAKTLGEKYNFPSMQFGEVIISLIGVLLFCVFTLSMSYLILLGNFPRGTEEEITSQLQTVNLYTSQYEECSDDLNSRFGVLDNSDQAAVESYNSDYDKCEEIRLEQNTAVDRYNYLLNQ